jgi:hypothetical protein
MIPESLVKVVIGGLKTTPRVHAFSGLRLQSSDFLNYKHLGDEDDEPKRRDTHTDDTVFVEYPGSCLFLCILQVLFLFMIVMSRQGPSFYPFPKNAKIRFFLLPPELEASFLG